MSNDYHDAVDGARLDAAARRVLGLLVAEHRMLVRELADHAVSAIFCTCVTDVEDACEGRVSAIHTELIAEVVRRVEAVARDPAAAAVLPDIVDIASEQSFPASDPPAWVWGHRPAPARRGAG